MSGQFWWTFQLDSRCKDGSSQFALHRICGSRRRFFLVQAVLLVLVASFITYDIRSHGLFVSLSWLQFFATSTPLCALVDVLTVRTHVCVCFRVQHSQTSLQVRADDCLPAGLEQNQPLHPAGFQLRRLSRSWLVAASPVTPLTLFLCSSSVFLAGCLNTPHYYSECVRMVGPLIKQGREKEKTAAAFMFEKAVQSLLWVWENGGNWLRKAVESLTRPDSRQWKWPDSCLSFLRLTPIFRTAFSSCWPSWKSFSYSFSGTTSNRHWLTSLPFSRGPGSAWKTPASQYPQASPFHFHFYSSWCLLLSSLGSSTFSYKEKKLQISQSVLLSVLNSGGGVGLLLVLLLAVMVGDWRLSLMSLCVTLQWQGVCVVLAGPWLFLHQLNMAAALTNDCGHQDLGSGAADMRMKALRGKDISPSCPSPSGRRGGPVVQWIGCLNTHKKLPGLSPGWLEIVSPQPSTVSCHRLWCSSLPLWDWVPHWATGSWTSWLQPDRNHSTKLLLTFWNAGRKTTLSLTPVKQKRWW